MNRRTLLAGLGLAPVAAAVSMLPKPAAAGYASGGVVGRAGGLPILNRGESVVPRKSVAQLGFKIDTTEVNRMAREMQADFQCQTRAYLEAEVAKGRDRADVAREMIRSLA